ncbi:hypothetical protein DBR47_12370 [Paucibacter sp. KBW04]|uniref:DUF3800 domain-containing protein n=1 Tax=Paucibacter sp. KBW04 TaxID=2153361 RepID=UPI000F5619FA|nr:DUF3800 domain-containing protein [Paucibacter sp. KBW04]RQO58500.1 hypothetical protein DBR47_12370 [Paucibacter sp. KBW04]
MAFDWGEMRAMMIGVHGIRRADDKFAFFYDETNNIRKFALTDAGTNVNEHKNFVLGGIVLQEGQALPDIAPLREALGMQVNAPEIKFKHIASGDFEAALASHKMARFLAWLTEHRLAIHYSSINIVYWSIVDIVDSIIASKRFEAFSHARREMKNELYRIACMDKPAFLALMRRHGYPGIPIGKVGSFIADVDAFLTLHSPGAVNLPTELLKEMVRKATALTELPFLEGNDADVLIGSFSSFFTMPVLLFKNATHVFDREIQVEKSLGTDGFKQRAQDIDYRFSDSKTDPGIQLADVTVGLIGKYEDFVEKHRLPELLARKKAWSAAQTETFELLRGLIDYSDDVSNAFIHRITAMDSEWKNDTFMLGFPALSHLL